MLQLIFSYQLKDLMKTFYVKTVIIFDLFLFRKFNLSFLLISGILRIFKNILWKTKNCVSKENYDLDPNICLCKGDKDCKINEDFDNLVITCDKIV